MNITVGLGAGIFWALDTVILGIALSQGCFLDSRQAVFLAPFISTFLHDAFSCLWMLLYTGIRKQFRKVLRALKSRNGRVIILGAVFGGPVGMTGYVFSIRYLGASYTAMISALFPAFGALAAHFFLKERLKKSQTAGMAVSVCGLLLLGFSPQSGHLESFAVGLACAMLCIFGWVSEVIICAYGMRSSEVDNEQALMIRQAASALVHGAVIMNVLSAWPFIAEHVTAGAMGIVFLAAACGTVSYLCYYRTIRVMGPSKGMALNVTYSAWAIIFEFLILGNKPGMLKVLSGLLILSGALLTALDLRTVEKRKMNGISGD